LEVALKRQNWRPLRRSIPPRVHWERCSEDYYVPAYMPTSEISVKRKFNFRENPKGELPRIHILGTSVNR